MKKKKFKFNVKLCVVELSSVPFVSGILFTKIRLDGATKFVDFTTREEVRDHCVKWNKRTEFEVKMVADSSSGILEKLICRLSVRKETRSGLSHNKMGYVDLNLAEYACQGQISKNFILQGYSDKHRLDNSLLKVEIHMTLTKGDPLFKVPATSIQTQELLIDDSSSPHLLNEKNKADSAMHSSNANSVSKGSESVRQISSGASELGSLANGSQSPQPSVVSQLSKTPSDPVRAMNINHTRTQSLDNVGHTRTPSSGSAKMFLSLRKPANCERDQRIDSTRVDTDGIVDELLGSMSLEDSDNHPKNGLQLYIGDDGIPSVTGHAPSSLPSA